MNWQKVIIYILGGVALIVLGWLLHSAFIPKPTSIVTETVKYDTTYVTKQVKVTETKVIERPIYIDSSKIYADSISGIKDETTFFVKHIILDDPNAEKPISWWKLDIEPKIRTIKEYITRDSIRTVYEAKYLPTPFFLNTWFYISVALTVLTTLSIIF